MQPASRVEAAYQHGKRGESSCRPGQEVTQAMAAGEVVVENPPPLDEGANRARAEQSEDLDQLLDDCCSCRQLCWFGVEELRPEQTGDQAQDSDE